MSAANNDRNRYSGVIHYLKNLVKSPFESSLDLTRHLSSMWALLCVGKSFSPSLRYLLLKKFLIKHTGSSKMVEWAFLENESYFLSDVAFTPLVNNSLMGYVTVLIG